MVAHGVVDLLGFVVIIGSFDGPRHPNLCVRDWYIDTTAPFLSPTLRFSFQFPVIVIDSVSIMPSVRLSGMHGHKAIDLSPISCFPSFKYDTRASKTQHSRALLFGVSGSS